MSEEAQVLEQTTEVAAPAATAEAIEPVTQPEAPVGKLANKRDVMRRFAEQAETPVPETPSESPPAESTAVDANGRAHGPDGKFIAATEVAAPPAEPTAEPPSFIRIPVPEGDPLRSQGVTEIPVAPEHERTIKALLNRESHRRERDEFRTRFETEREARIRAETLAQTLQQQRDTAYMSPEVAAVYNELKAVNPDVAESYLRGELAKMNGQLTEADQTARQQWAEERQQQEAVQFVTDTRSQVAETFPSFYTQHESFQADFNKAMRLYGVELSEREARGEQVEATQEGFVEHLKLVYAANPVVRSHAQLQYQKRINAEREAAAKTAKTEQEARAKAEREEAAKRHQTQSPLSRIPSAAHVNGQSITPENELKNMNAEQRRRTLKQSITRLVQGR